MVRKTIKGDSDMIRYYVETKSGKRYRIEEALLIGGTGTGEVMGIFDKITDRFTWVEIVEEVE